MPAINMLVLLVVLSTVATSDGGVQKISQISLSGPLQNMQIYKGNLYIGGRNYTYVVDKDLHYEIFAKTCNDSEKPNSNCKNDNQVLIANQKTGHLVICGTGNNGSCQVWDMNRNLTVVSEEMKVAGDIKKTAVGMIISDGNLMIAVTYGPNIDPEESSCNSDKCLSYSYPISTRILTEPFLKLVSKENEEQVLKLKINVRQTTLGKDITLDDYIIYYKSSFEYNGYSYFLTNQKEYVEGSNYVSKLIRICQNDTALRSYTDIVLTCHGNDAEYNLLQSAILVDTPGISSSEQSTKIFISTFTKGLDPEKPIGDSVICMAPLSSLDVGIELAKQINALCPEEDEDLKQMYLQQKQGRCQNNTVRNEIDCQAGFNTLFSYVIGKNSVNLTSSFLLPAENGYISTIHGFKQGTKNITLSAGTSSGKVYRLYVRKDSIVAYDNFTADRGFVIKAIYQTSNSSVDDSSIQDDEIIYIMSSSKIFKFRGSNCSEYKTCNQTMETHDPSCGWCVFENRSTRMKDCPDKQWLSSLENCVSIEPVPQAVSVLQPLITKVEIRAKGLPAGRDQTVTYQCRFTYGSNTNMFPVNRTGDKFSCPLPNVTEHTDAKLELWVKTDGTEFFLASHSFLFYNCSHYNRCGDCIKRNHHINCSWCYNAAKCMPPTSCSGDVTCPELQNNSATLYAHSEKETSLRMKVLSVTDKLTLKITISGTTGPCKADSNVLACNITVSLQDPGWKKRYPIKITYNDNVELDDNFDNYVTVYDCEKLQMRCDYCNALNTNYYCGWNLVEEKCKYKYSKATDGCPAPNITKISPKNGQYLGGTSLTISGDNFGYNTANITVKLGQLICNITEISHFIGSHTLSTEDLKIGLLVVNAVVCKTPAAYDDDHTTVAVVVQVNGTSSSNSTVFKYLKTRIWSVTPTFGPMAGGTRITLYGENLGIGNRNVKIISLSCSDVGVFPKTSPDEDRFTNSSQIQCVTNSHNKEQPQNIKAFIDGQPCTDSNNITFNYIGNPTITSKSTTKGFLSGGTVINILGTFMKNAHSSEITVTYDNDIMVEICNINSSTLTICKVPKASKKLLQEFDPELKNGETRRKRDVNSATQQDVDVIVNLDGFQDRFKISYFRDPILDPFPKEVLVYGTDKQELVLTGKYLNLVATKYDVKVTIGLEECSVVELTEFSIRCLAPKTQPDSGESHLPEVNVTIGNIRKRVGYLEYEQKLEIAYIIGGAVAGGLLFIIVIVLGIGIYKYRKVGEKARDYQKSLSDMEMEIRRVAREEFLDMHTTMSSVNRNLVEQGFPYHSYQQYACNVMFSVDYLWTEPVMTDDERIKANKGMEMMESLFYNKFFIVSVISTMEKQKRFFIREKANLAGNLCAVLMGKMDYLEEILKMLLSNLVQETPSKKQKSLFRRCESITEKLLSNWLSLCLYPHIRANSGSPLYLLYIATQKTMESGPIDAILGEAKYTLYEEKLLKKWSSTEEGKQDLKFEAKTLTLNVVVDNGETIYKCKVLDCDTISQVKSKCMAQIYVNYPASQLNVDPHDLDLEWHEGFGGALRLKDEDNTSKRDGPLVRLNTLAHYNVKDESNMALVDPHGAENKEEDYVNLTNVNADNACDGSLDSSEPLHPRDGQNSGALQHWHLVRKEEETSKQGKSAIAELYLNRLFTTKQCLMEYISTLFNIVLEKDRCPPPTKCLFDFLDDLGDRHKIDADTLYTWKSHSYAIRVWASLIKMPSLLFDVNIPNYVEENLDVISQVFIESFSLSSQKFTKDSPSQKLIFHNEMILYRDRVKEFYKNVKVDSQTQDEYRQYMTEVNKQQQQTNFNKVSALYRLYKQLKPYFEEILEDLATCKETSNLRLDKKLEEVMDIMDDEDK